MSTNSPFILTLFFVFCTAILYIDMIHGDAEREEVFWGFVYMVIIAAVVLFAVVVGAMFGAALAFGGKIKIDKGGFSI